LRKGGRSIKKKNKKLGKKGLAFFNFLITQRKQSSEKSRTKNTFLEEKLRGCQEEWGGQSNKNRTRGSEERKRAKSFNITFGDCILMWGH